jgi:hypothetical protein
MGNIWAEKSFWGDIFAWDIRYDLEAKNIVKARFYNCLMKEFC